MTQQSSSFLPAIDKLIGRENYNTWSFAVKTYLQHENLWDCVDPEGEDEDAQHILKARSKIILLVHPSNYVHIQNCVSAQEVWQRLKNTFEDSGLTRKVALIRTLTSTRLQNCSSMEDYVNKIMTASHKLQDIGAAVADEWLATFLLAGLTDRYTPMIMALENSGIVITADAIKTKLLQEYKPSSNAPKAFYSSKKNRKQQSSNDRTYTSSSGMSNVRCYSCNQYGHISKNCPNKKQTSSSSQSAQCLPTSHPKGLIAAFSTFYDNPNDWFFDSASSFHMTMREDWLNDQYPTIVDKIAAANNSLMEVKSTGQVTVEVVCKSSVKQLPVNGVLYVPDLSVNLLSISQIVSKRYTVIFDMSGCKVLDENSEIIATGTHINSMFKLNTLHSSEKQCFVSKNCAGTSDIWHQRMAHLNTSDLSKLKNHLATGISFTDANNKNVCVPCLKGKQSRFPFPSQGSRATSILDLIHSDLCGPMEVASFNGSKYFLTLIDDLSRKVFVYFLKTKENVQEIFENFKILYEKQLSKVIKIFRSDNGGEFITSELEDYLKKCGIIHQTSAPYTPEQNGLAERMNRTLVERAKSALIAAGLPKIFWAEAVSTVAYLINRSPTRGHGKTPEEIWTGVKPDLSHLKVFGCKAMMHVPKRFRRKFDSKSTEMIFVGYCENTKGYRLIHPVTRRLTISRDVVFIENQFIRNVNSTEELQESVGDVFPFFESELDSDEHNPIQVDATIEMDSEVNNPFKCNEDNDALDETSDIIPSDFDQNLVPTSNTISLPNIRRSERVPKPKVFPDFVTYCVNGYIPDDPSTVDEALSSVNSKVWKAAMIEEFNSLLENDTWKLTELPPNRKPIQCKWVFKTKRDADGRIVRYKARLVAKGFTQQHGIDYGETFSPVVRYTSIRMLLAISAKYNLEIEQMDVVTAFLHGKIDEDIYMVQPPEFAQDNRVCKLNKALYGLKQSSRQWYLELDSNLKRNGFQRSLVDPCVYFDINSTKMTFVAVFIDDLLIFSNDDTKKLFLKTKLRERFKMTDLGEAKFCVGLRITRDPKFNMVECNTVSTPMDLNQKLSKNMSPQSSSEREEMSMVPYRELVGGLLYISQGTRPDISFAVNTLSIFNNNPGKAHWIAAKRVLRYLKATIDTKLQYSKDELSNFSAFCDADWASNIDDRRSCSGYVFLSQGGAISWCSRRQPTIALSTTEAEYMALSSTVQESSWLNQFEGQFNFGGERQPIRIFCDNTSALDLAKTTGYSARTKHIDVRHHYLREHVESGQINLVHIPTEDMVADVLTKPLNSKKHLVCSEGMGLLF